jgi:hypothetical protein
VQSASAVRDLGVAGAAASVLGIGVKRGLFDAPAACSAGSEPTEESAVAVEAPLDTSTNTSEERTHATVP